MKAGLYINTNPKSHHGAVAKLEGRRLQIERTKLDDGWAISVVRTRKPIDKVYTPGEEAATVVQTFNTKRTLGFGFLLSDEGLDALLAACCLAKRLRDEAHEDARDDKEPGDDALPFLSHKHNDPRKRYIEEPVEKEEEK